MSIVVGFNRRQIEREAPLTERNGTNDLFGVEMIDLNGLVDAIADVHHHVRFEKARQTRWKRLPVLVVDGSTIGCKCRRRKGEPIDELAEIERQIGLPQADASIMAGHEPHARVCVN